MPASVPCPKCDAILSTPANATGRLVQCPQCKESFRLPAARPAPSRGVDDDFDEPQDERPRRRSTERTSDTPSGRPVRNRAVDDSDDDLEDERRRRQQRQGDEPSSSKWVFIGLGIFVGVAVLATVIVLATRKQDEPKEVVGRPEITEQPKRPQQEPPAPVPEKSAPQTVAPKETGREWLRDAEAELAAARERANRIRPEPLAREQTLLTAAEYMDARQAAEGTLYWLPPDNPAKLDYYSILGDNCPAGGDLLIPRTLRALEREALTQVVAQNDAAAIETLVNPLPRVRPLLDPKVREVFKARWPWKQRKGLFAKFTQLTADKRPFSLLHPFDDLTGEQMHAAVEAATKANASGFGSLDKHQR